MPKLPIFLISAILTLTAIWLTTSYIDSKQKGCTQNIILKTLSLEKTCNNQAMCTYDSECSFEFKKENNNCLFTPINVCTNQTKKVCSTKMMIYETNYVGPQYYSAKESNCLDNFPKQKVRCKKSNIGHLIGEKGVCSFN